MAATLEQIRQKMLEMAPQLGTVETPSALAAQTATVARLATGSLSAQRYVGYYMLRPDASNAANRAPRIVTNYASSTGVLTHAGAAYTDTTETDEVLELHRHNPQKLDSAIAYAVSTIRVLDIDMLPTVPNKSEYSLAPFTWIQEEDDVLAVGYRNSPVVSRNRGFEKWSAGGFADHWTIAGASASLARTSTTPTGTYGATLTRAGADVTLTQTVTLLETGVSADSLRGQTLVLVLRVAASTANQVRAAVADGTQTVTTSYHSGGGAYEELTATITVDNDATTLTIQIQVNTSDGAASIDQCYLAWASAVNDSLRRDHYRNALLNRDEWEFGDAPLSLRLPARGRGGQYIVYSQRPISGFIASRIAGGTADGDSVDVLVDTAAIASLARLYRGLMSQRDENTTRYQQLAGYWEKQREIAQEKLLRIPGAPARDFGISFMPPMLAPTR